MYTEDSFQAGAFHHLCQNTRDAIKILRSTDCNLSDDTYLDHMAEGIKRELLEHHDLNRRLEFWNSSDCSDFVLSYKNENIGCQSFILKLMRLVCFTHSDIQEQSLQIVVDVLVEFRGRKTIPNEAFLDLLIQLSTCLSRTPAEEEIKLLNTFVTTDLNLWNNFLKPILSTPLNDLPISHFWKMSFIKLTSQFLVSQLMYNSEHGGCFINEFYPEFVVTQIGRNIFGEILDLFLHMDRQLDISSYEKLLQTFVNDQNAVNLLGIQNQIKALVFLKNHQKAQSLLEKCFQLNGNEEKHITQSWYKSVKPFLESRELQEMIPDESLLNCLFINLKVRAYSGAPANTTILAVQGISNIKLGIKLRVKFENHVFEILKSFVGQGINSLELGATENVRLISSIISAINKKEEKHSNLTFDRLKVLSTLSKSSELSIHLKSQILECLKSFIRSAVSQKSGLVHEFSIEEIVLELWSHSLSSNDWRTKDLLLSILAIAFRNPTFSLTLKNNDDSVFPWRCLLNFIEVSLENINSFVRASTIELISSIFQFINGHPESKNMKIMVEEPLKQLSTSITQIYRLDTEAVVRRAILKEKALVYLYNKGNIESVYIGK